MKAVLVLAGATMLAACGETARPTSAGSITVTRVPLPSNGLERVMGQDAAQLTHTLGAPATDLREGAARKLQFQGPICVLDAYLYPKGNGEAVVTHIDARQPDGSPIDRASCVAALSHRAGSK